MIIFVVPVYNEEDNIVSLLNQTSLQMLQLGLTYMIIMVNDGSTDKTVQLADSLKHEIPLQIIGYARNRGVGEAFRMGFQAAIEIAKESDIIITKEADNTSDPNILRSMILKIEEGNDLVLASCYSKEGAVLGTSFFRRIVSRIANIMMRIILPEKNIHTFSSFYRAYSLSSLRRMRQLYGEYFIREQGFECMLELLIKFIQAKEFKIIEVPMVLDGSKRTGKSKMKIIKTTIGFLRVMLKEGVFHSRNIK